MQVIISGSLKIYLGREGKKQTKQLSCNDAVRGGRRNQINRRSIQSRNTYGDDERETGK